MRVDGHDLGAARLRVFKRGSGFGPQIRLVLIHERGDRPPMAGMRRSAGDPTPNRLGVDADTGRHCIHAK